MIFLIPKIKKLFIENFFRKKFAKIHYLVLDVDGVLTDGGIYLDHEGNTFKKFSVKDGLGIKLLQENNIQIIFMSGGSSSSTSARAKNLGIEYCFVNIKNKSKFLLDLQNELGFDFENLAYVGDDLNDVVVRSIVKLLICPKDACKEMRDISDLVLTKNGGNGAIRELCEIILKSKKCWEKYSTYGFIKQND